MPDEDNIRSEREQYWNEDIRPGIDRGQVFPIDRDRQICVHAFQGNGFRFARIFQDVWYTLPRDVRDDLYSYWCRGFHGIKSLYPLIEVTEAWAGRRDSDLGVTSLLGHNLVFHAPTVDQLSDAGVSALIAHVLSHVYQETIQPGIFLPGIYDPRIEFHADGLVAEWGFDLSVIEEDLLSRELDGLF